MSRGHAAAIWSPRGNGTHGIGSSLTVQGVLSGTARVSVAVDVGHALEGLDFSRLRQLLRDGHPRG